jgi:hypothetical protein
MTIKKTPAIGTLLDPAQAARYLNGAAGIYGKAKVGELRQLPNYGHYRLESGDRAVIFAGVVGYGDVEPSEITAGSDCRFGFWRTAEPLPADSDESFSTVEENGILHAFRRKREVHS